MSRAPSRKFWPSQVEDSQNRAGSGGTNNKPPSRSGVRKLVCSSAEDVQNRGDSDYTNYKPLSFQDVAPRPPSLTQNLDIKDLAATPPSLNAVNSQQSTSGTEHLKVHDGSMTKPPPPAGALTHGN
ncbi:unnamed protein product [Lactuca saligna]|uniref:Uncharacterized protein n=1 Tax=Lactuca saligna TaxID=75948 RepID=A0AA35Y597_LACSI|nr:unnamed protein product [Lactuca saligna]